MQIVHNIGHNRLYLYDFNSIEILSVYFTFVFGLIIILDEKYLWIIVLSRIFYFDYAVYGIFFIYYINKY